MSESIVIVGGGHASATLCSLLAANGGGKRVVLFTGEPHLPYDRPALSKTFLAGEEQGPQILTREDLFSEANVDVRLNQHIEHVDLADRVVVAADGSRESYGQLVLATGSRARWLPGLPADLENVMTLRSLGDALRLRAALRKTARLTVVGAGFIGLEVAATARQLGCEVTVLEAAPRILGRALSATMAGYLMAKHAEKGISIRTGVQIGKPGVEGNRLTHIEVDGQMEPVELLLVGVGAVPEAALASEAGLEVDDGILVDGAMRTSDHSVLAIGDCARYSCSRYMRSLRLESVQSANEQAKAAAATLTGMPTEAYGVVPWFWSEQGDLRLQMAGMLPAESQQLVRRGNSGDGFSIFHLQQRKLVYVESVNALSDHVAAKKLLGSGKCLDPEKLVDPAIPLKTLL